VERPDGTEKGEASEDDVAALVDWVREVTGALDVTAERRSAGASRAGYAVDATLPDGSTRELWLRVDTGYGPQSHTKYTVRREADVYAALRDTAVGVPTLVAVHPTREVFLAERLPGRNWFAEIEDASRQQLVATDYMQRLAALHALDPSALDLPGFGAPGTVRDHVHEELDEWDAQLAMHADPDPLITWALRWLRTNVPDDGDWPVVLVHGDAGPGNFLYEDDHVVAVMDWEMAHYGDLHDDLGWVYVRDVQERLSSLPDRMRDYEAAAGRSIDLARLHYFRVLAQTRCAIGTRNGLLARDSRGEIANHLIYSTLHQRLLVEALAAALDAELPEAPPLVAADPGLAWMYDVATLDLRDTVVPAIEDGFAARRAKGLARLLKYLREQHVLGAADHAAEADDLRIVLGPGDPTRTDLCAALAAGAVDDADALWWCARAAARATQIAAPAMGALATRHYAPLPGN
jgi:aminoglycoside phosphotransferase (APT) family kinase protein